MGIIKTDRVIIRGYQADRLASVILKNYPDLRDSEKYQQTMDYVLDITMSCDQMECYGWYIDNMSLAVDRDIELKKNINFIAEGDYYREKINNSALFLVNYDLLCRL